jgi:hypothetical protein
MIASARLLWPDAVRSQLSGVSALSRVVRQSPASKDVNTEADESTMLEAVAKQRLVKAEQTEKTLCVR